MQLHLSQSILNAEQIRQTDHFTIKNEPIASIDLMERASNAFVAWFTRRFKSKRLVHIFCGTGNNGGDGLAIARLLNNHNYDVNIWIIGDTESGSRDFKINLDFIKDYITPSFLNETSQFPFLAKDDIVVDAIFGSGLTRPVTSHFAELINHINLSASNTKVTVDIASGLSCDQEMQGGSILEVDFTVTFQAPKLAHLLPQNDAYTGQLEVVDIGLDEEFIHSLTCKYHLVTSSLIRSIFKYRGKYDHKGAVGHDLIIAGSHGKMGAAVICTQACLRAGAGLVTAHLPQCGVEVLQSTIPEAMVSIDVQQKYIATLPVLTNYTTVGIGPGIGTANGTAALVKSLLDNYRQPMVFDADAINILATNKKWLDLVPRESILTPHVGEFRRLVGDWKNDFERLQNQINFCIKHKVILVLKGAHTSICNSDGMVLFNATGNPGMATGGSGDVLTGIITGLLGQRYTSFESAVLGVYLHGRAGDIYAKKYCHESLIASDLIANLGEAIKLSKT